MRPFSRSVRCTVVLLTALMAVATPLHAQDDSVRPAFSLATSHIFTTKESPALTLTHRHVDHLDFRVYRVNDALGFFGKLRDAHELGSEDPVVPQELTWLERTPAGRPSAAASCVPSCAVSSRQSTGASATSSRTRSRWCCAEP